MLGEHQAIGAGDLHLDPLERPDDRLEQFAALAHQDQNVAVARFVLVDQLAHRTSDAPRQLHPRAGLAHGIERRVPAFDLLAVVRLLRLPDFDRARRRVGQRDVRRKSVQIGGDAQRHVRPLEHLVHRGQNDRTGAERMLELADDEVLFALFVRGLEVAQHLGEFFRRGVLERIDRLLFVADREHGALYAARAGAGSEFSSEPAHDLPLLVAGVLRLVDQDMIDAEIELEMHPGCIDVGEKLERLVDQVVIVEQPAALLLPGVARHHLVRDGDKGGAAVAQRHAAPPLEQIPDALLLVEQALRQCRHRLQPS